MKKEYSIYDLLVFIFGCTICFILIANTAGWIILRIPTTKENEAIRTQFADIIKVISGSLMTIIVYKVKEAFNK